MDAVRRHLFEILTVAVLLAVALYVISTAAAGRALHRNEKAAKTLLEEIFASQEARRLANLEPPYLFLSELLASPSSSSGLRELWPEIRRVAHAPPGLELYSFRGYFVTVGLQTTGGRILFERPEDAERPTELGIHFRALAWPCVYGETGGVFYYADSQGWLFQGENAEGLFQGDSNVDLAAMDPYPELLELELSPGSEPLTLHGGLEGVRDKAGYERREQAFRRKWSSWWALRDEGRSPTGRAAGTDGSSPH
ncbi:MAG: hypothetical protein AB1486_02695 [Planctomycetota bacterium]